MRNSSDDVFEEFRVEMVEMAQQLDEDLLRWQSAPDDTEFPKRMLRQIHTLKGSAGFLQLQELADLCHAGEDLLAVFQKRSEPPSKWIIRILTETIAAIQGGLHASKVRGETPVFHDLVFRLRRLAADPELEDTPGEGGAAESSSTAKGEYEDSQPGGAVRPARLLVGGAVSELSGDPALGRAGKLAARAPGGIGALPEIPPRLELDPDLEPIPRLSELDSAFAPLREELAREGGPSAGVAGRATRVGSDAILAEGGGREGGGALGVEADWKGEGRGERALSTNGIAGTQGRAASEKGAFSKGNIDGTSSNLVGSRLLGAASPSLEPGEFTLGPWSAGRLQALQQGKSASEVREDVDKAQSMSSFDGGVDLLDHLLEDESATDRLIEVFQENRQLLENDVLFPDLDPSVQGEESEAPNMRISGANAFEPGAPGTFKREPALAQGSQTGLTSDGEATDPMRGPIREATDPMGAPDGEATDPMGVSDGEATDPMGVSDGEAADPMGVSSTQLPSLDELELLATVCDVPIPEADTPEEATRAVSEALVSAGYGPVLSAQDFSVFRERASTVRVDVAKLDTLLNLLGDLIQEKHRQAPLVDDLRAGQNIESVSVGMVESHARFGRLLSEVQDAVLRTRMLPLQGVFRRYPRIVQQHADRMGKEIELVLTGEETELDRTLIEGLFDPLIHLLRNAIDHGIEAPADRVRRGKARKGTIELTASQEGNQIVIEIRDDGRGIDPAEIVKRAVESRLLSPDRAKEINDQEKIDLIFLSGFTSKDDVTDTSGRGVGMSVVRDHLRQIGGLITVHSRLGEGTTMRLAMPLTLAIIQVLLVKLEGTRYAIPLSSVVGVHRIERERLTMYRGGWYLPSPGSMLPVFFLGVLLGLKKPALPPERCYVAEVGVAEKRYGLLVDGFAGIYESVIRSLDGSLTRLPGVVGGTAIGAGDLVLVLDVGTLFEGQSLPLG